MTVTRIRGAVFKTIAGAAVLALASAGAARASVITFEGNAGPASNQTTIQQTGYSITFYDPAAAAPRNTVQVGRFIDGGNPASCGSGNICPTNNTSTYLDLFNTGFIDIVRDNPDTSFHFSGLDASFIATSGVGYPLAPAAVSVYGFLADGSVSAIQFNLPRTTAFRSYTLADAAGGEAFGKLNFTEIAIVSFRCNAQGACSGLDNGDGQVGLDNILVTEVPEPATASLLAFGLLGLGLRARRRA